MKSFVHGKNVVVTGTFPNQYRDDVERTLTELGAVVQRGVGSHTDYLICGAKTGARKVQDAEKLGVKMLNLSDYQAMVSGNFNDEEVVIKPKLTHEEYLSSIPENYGGW